MIPIKQTVGLTACKLHHYDVRARKKVTSSNIKRNTKMQNQLPLLGQLLFDCFWVWKAWHEQWKSCTTSLDHLVGNPLLFFFFFRMMKSMALNNGKAVQYHSIISSNVLSLGNHPWLVAFAFWKKLLQRFPEKTPLSLTFLALNPESQ